jgi:Tol biopolymer transport system component
VKPGALWTLQPATLRTEALVILPNGSYVGHPAVSADGARLAYSALVPDATGVYGPGAAVFVMDLASRTASTVALATHDAAYTEAAWAPDGRSLYVTREARGQPPQIERVTLPGSAVTAVTKGHSPTTGADGRLAYLTGRRDGRQTLWILDRGTPRRLIHDREFLALSTPRLAPDASGIVFAAVGGPRGGARGRPAAPRATGWLRLPTAFAHGGPAWDLWFVGADGAQLRRLTNLNEDFLAPAWSPDGRWIAAAGEFGLYLLEFKTGRLLRVSGESSSGGLTWMAEGKR